MSSAQGGERTARRCRVTGRVQGVFFRAATCDEAERLGLSGSVRNLPDGSVEVRVHGDAQAVAALCEWLHRGPPHARVDAVRCEPLPGAPPGPGFRVV